MRNKVVSWIWLFSWLVEQVLIVNELESSDSLSNCDAMFSGFHVIVSTEMWDEVVLWWAIIS
jgi:hypothetical protein